MYISMNMIGGAPMETHSIAEARRNLPRLIREAEHGKAVQLTRHGEPVAVLLGRRMFERLASGRRSFGEAFDDFARTTDVSGLGFDAVQFLEGARAPDPGRDFRL